MSPVRNSRHVLLSRSAVSLLGLVCALLLLAPGAQAQNSDLWGNAGELWTPQSRLPDFSFAGYHSGNAPLPTVAVQVNVKDFGAVGDGVADDSQAFLNAIAAASNGAVLAPAGRYKITQVLKITKSNVVLRGAGQGTTVLYFPNNLTQVLGTAPAWAGGSFNCWSWGGGFIWLEGAETGGKIADVTAPALRGGTTLTLSTTAGINVGTTIRLVETDPADDSLGLHLHAGYANSGSATPRKMIDWAVKIVGIVGNTVTLERPLRADVRAAWAPAIYASAPTVRECGVEELTIEFPNSSYGGHHAEAGFNGIFLHTVEHCWVRNVTILDCDSGILGHDADFPDYNPSRFCTYQGIRFANQWRSSTSITGHHGFAFEGPQDMLVTDFKIERMFFHDATLDWLSCGNVFTKGQGFNMNCDCHRYEPHENLFTDLDMGPGDTLWYGSRNQDSGNADGGLPHAARLTLWNIRASNPPTWYPTWPQLTIVGMTRWATLKTDQTWIENIAPASLNPPNIYLAQLTRRLNGGPSNAPPTVATAAAANPNPVAGTTSALSVLGADDAGEAALTYTWATTGSPPAAVAFSVNGTNAAKNATATFSRAGSYTLQATIRDAGNLTVTNSVVVTVSQTLTAITVAPASATVVLGNSQQFTATASDQFAQTMASQPAFTWTVSGGGTVSASGLFSAATVGGPFIVTAASGGKSATASATVQSTTNAVAFPLAVSANGRYLVDQSNKPFRLNVESAWLMSVNAVAADVDTYIADRKAKGFNAFIIMAMVHQGGYAESPTAPVNKAGQAPFLTPGDFSTPNEAYWTFIDTIIDKAAAQDMAVVFAYSYLGYGGGNQGWWAEFNNAANTQTACYNFGVWLGNRYKTRKNILWHGCGDYTPPTGSEGAMRVHKQIEGIKSVIPQALFSAEMSPPDTMATDPPDFTAVMSMNSFYGAGPSFNLAAYQTADRAWNSSPAKPAWDCEPPYENVSIPGANETGSRQEVRRTQYWSILGGGSAGGNFGAAGIWGWNNVQATLNSNGSLDMQRLFALFGSLPWQEMMPSGTAAGYIGKTLVATGQGSGNSFITAAGTPTGTWLLAYVPPTGTGATTFGIDMSAMSSSTRARWYNPTSGAYTLIGSGFANTGTRSFTTPGDNGTALNDWLLVLDIATGPPNAPPTVATVAAANPGTVTGMTTALSVLGADDGGEPALTYTWATTGSPPAAVAFSTNGTNAAKNATATFSKAGSYTLQATIRDAGNLTVISSVMVTVNQALTSIVVSPASSTVSTGATQQFTATARDQFAQAMASQPAFTWTVSGGGTISSSGLFTAGSTAGGPFTVTAASGSASGTASVSVSSGFAVKINFQPAASPTVAGYLVDSGLVFADRGNGYSYGWSEDTSDVARDRNAISDQLRDTFEQLQRPVHPNASWELAVPNGTYQVVMVSGDPSYTDSVYALNLEGVLAVAGTPTGSNLFLSTAPGFQVTVNDGRLTLSNAPGSVNNKVCFIEVTQVSGGPVNQAPTVATTASANPNPVIGTTAALSVLGADDAGEAALTYTWATTGSPPAAVAFSANGTNAAKSVTATFSKAGSYTLQATIRDVGNLTATSSVVVTVNQTLTAIAVAPTSATVTNGGTQAFTAIGSDQFAQVMASQPTFAWTVSGGGTISASGLFTATTVGGPFTVTAANGGKSGTANVTVQAPANQAPTVATAASAGPNPVTASTTTLSVLGADDAGEAALTYTWATTGTPPAPVTFSANGTNGAKTATATFAKAGSYTFQVTIRDVGNLTVTSSVVVTVNQTLTAIVVAPATVTVPTGGTQTFTATANDQFGQMLASQPTIAWTASGGGAIAATGVFTAGSTAGGPFTVTASSGGKTGTASVSVSATSAATLSALADAFVRDGSYAATNYGTALDLQSKTDIPGWTRQAYVKFDLTGIPGTLGSVKLRLYGSAVVAGTPTVTVQAFGVADTSWTEAGLVWNTKPVAGATVQASATVSATAQWYEWDVTAYVAAERAAGRNVISLALITSTISSTYADFNAREAATNQPQLLVNVVPPQGGG